jgi:ABC-type Fe3+/spermidine/putrescine transport system ATPase subunit
VLPRRGSAQTAKVFFFFSKKKSFLPLTALSFRGLTVERDRRTVVEDVSFTAPSGAVTALLGGIGAGKTTLLAAAAGLLPIARGAVVLGGVDITKRRRGVALLAPGTSLGRSATVGDALRAVAVRSARPGLAALLDRLGLAGMETRRLWTLSHGEHFAALAAARLLPVGEALLVDEAGAGLDRAGRELFIAALRSLAHEGVQEGAQEGHSIVFATRDESLALVADHLVLLDRGRTLQAGTPASCYAEPQSAAAALLTGPANIMEGTVRERRGGAYIWTAAGTRFWQTATPDTQPPPLGSLARFCLRPERVMLLGAGEKSDNMLAGVVTSLHSAGHALAMEVGTACGVLMVSAPSWPRPSANLLGEVMVGWDGGAATVIE